MLRSSDLDFVINYFYSIIFAGFTSFVPYVRRNSEAHGPPWYNDEIRSLRNQRNKMWKVYASTRCTSDYNAYSDLRKQFNTRSGLSYYDYLNTAQGDIKLNPKAFWNFVNMHRKGDGYPSYMLSDNVQSNNPLVIAGFFKSAYVRQNIIPNLNFLKNFSPSVSLTMTMKDLFVNKESVIRAMDNIESSFSSGPDGVPAIVLKSCNESLAGILSYIFNLSLHCGDFPALWKISHIVPIHKKGNKSQISNYRPISKLSSIPKLFEAVVLSSLNFHCKHLISSAQHGFVPGRSTITNLVSFTSDCLNAFEVGKQVDCVFTDFSKAFDKVSHELLVLKLKLLGFPDGFVKWVKSYLCNRVQRVVFRSATSDDIAVTSGVPQGSHLGPFLFILFVNDVLEVISSSKMLIFADDVKLFKVISSNTDCLNLQSDLNNFYVWCQNNSMFLNVDKCKIVSFGRKKISVLSDYHIDGIYLERVDGTRDLGVHLDSALNFHKHMDITVAKANAMLGFLRRWTKDFTDQYVLKTLYVSLVRSVVEYCVQVWCPYYSVHIDRIEQIQKRFIHFALRALPWNDEHSLPSYEGRLQLLSMDPLYKRRSLCQVLFVHRVLSASINAPELLSNIGLNVPCRPLRGSSYKFLYLSHHRTNYGRHEPLSFMSKVFNDCYEHIDFNFNVQVLKNQLILNLK